MRFLFIDSSVYVSCALIQEPGHDSELVVKLRDLLKTTSTTLLLPEVVELEFERVQADRIKELKQKVQEAQKQVRQIEVLSYLRGELQEVEHALGDMATRREQNLARVQDILGDLFTSPQVRRLSLTPEIMTRGYARALAGRLPYTHRSAPSLPDADSMIVETLAAFFANRPSDELIFCSGNTAHFAKWNDQQKRHDMHPSIASDLPSQTTFYKDLPSLIQEVLQTSVQPDEVARYSRAELSITTPAPSPEEWLAARHLYFDALAERLTESHRLVLNWLASRGSFSTSDLFETWFPMIPEQALHELEIDLLADKLVRADGTSREATQRGRDFLEYIRARREQEGYTLEGGEHDL